MRSTLLLAALLALSLVGVARAEDPGVTHLKQVRTADLSAIASGTAPVSDFTLTYRYTNQWGIDKLWQIQGTTLLIRDSVHTAAVADMARQQMIAGSALTPQERAIFDQEYGDWDRYSSQTLTPQDVRGLASALAGTQMLDAPARPGCGQNSWEVDVKVGNKTTQIFDVNAPGNDKLLAGLTPIKSFLGKHTGGTAISANEFAQRLINIALVTSPGAH